MKSFTASLIGAIVGLCMALPAPVHAEPLTFEFTGTVNAAAGTNLATLFPAGSQLTYRLTYDTSFVPFFQPSPTHAQYVVPGSASTEQFGYTVEVAGQQYYWSRAGNVFLHTDTENNSFAVDTSLSEISLAGAPAGSSPLWFPVAFDVNIFFAPGGGLPSTLLPSEFPALGTGSQFAFYLRSDAPSCAGCGADGLVTGSLSQVHRVPTPPALLLVGVGVLGFVQLARRLRARRSSN